MLELSIDKALEAMGVIQQERNYLLGCIRPDAPEKIRVTLQAEIDSRNALLDSIEAEAKKAELEFAAKLILVPEETSKYVEVKEEPVLIEK